MVVFFDTNVAAIATVEVVGVGEAEIDVLISLKLLDAEGIFPDARSGNAVSPTSTSDSMIENLIRAVISINHARKWRADDEDRSGERCFYVGGSFDGRPPLGGVGFRAGAGDSEINIF